METNLVDIANSFVEYCQDLLWSCDKRRTSVKVVPKSLHSIFCAPFSDAGIKRAMFSINGNKALGPDGFTSQFFKDASEIIGEDVCKDVKSFF